MKKLIQSSLLIFALSVAACHKSPPTPPPDHPNPPGYPNPQRTTVVVPACVQDQIQKIQAEPVANPPASVWQYDYLGQVVYYFPPECCDVPGKLIDANCNFMCSPDGGITGKGDGKCPDFFDKRTNEQLVWKDERQ